MDNILEYQKCDIKIVKLKREFRESNLNKLVSELLAKRRELITQSEKLENEAKNMMVVFDEAKSFFDKYSAKFNELSNANVEGLKENEIESIIKETVLVMNNFSALQKKALLVNDKAEKIMSEFRDAKQKMSIIKAKHDKGREELAKLEKKYATEIQDIAKQMKVLEGLIDPKLLVHYKAQKEDKIFPVFVRCVEESCGGCRQKLPSRMLENLKNNGKVTCEHCRRTILNI